MNVEKEEKFKGKYRVSSARLKNYDYSQNGAYFVTICTKNREHFFGKIVDGKMKLSEIGKIVENEWEKTETIRKNVELGEWIVMPNHFHAIVIINNDDNCTVETHCNASLQKVSILTEYHNKFGPQVNNLSSIIRGFKGTITKQIRSLGFADFAWQTRFHDHIIRNEDEFYRISKYIMYNINTWEKDKYF